MPASTISTKLSITLLITFISAAILFSVDPASGDDYSIKHITLHMKKEDSNKSHQHITFKQNEEARLLYKAGNKDLDSKDYDNAIARYRKAMSLEPSFPPIHYNLGMAHLAIGQKKEAAQHLKTFLELHPNAFNGNEVKDLIKLLNN